MRLFLEMIIKVKGFLEMTIRVKGGGLLFGKRFSCSRLFQVLLLNVVLLFAALSVPPAIAHAPHDVVVSLVIAPDYNRSKRVLAVVRGRVMLSNDGGASFREVVSGLSGETQKIRQLVHAVADPSAVYATTIAGSILRTRDWGESWQPLSGEQPAYVNRLYVAPGDADRLFALSRFSRLDVSVDGGASWQRATVPAGRALPRVLSVAEDGRSMLGGTSKGVLYASGDLGQSWQRGHALQISGRLDLLERVVVGGREFLFAGSSEGDLLRSSDNGASFEKVGLGLPEERVMAITAQSGGVLWLVTWKSGAFRSTDAGKSWTMIAEGLTHSKQADSVEAPHWRSIAAAPGDSRVLLVGGFDGLFVLDSMEKWLPVETLVNYIAGLSLSPNFAEDQHVAVSTYVRGLLLSGDGGRTWSFSNEGLLQEKIDEGNRFAPIKRMHNVHFSPDFAADNTLFSATWTRVIRSTDGGASWQPVGVGKRPPGSALRQYVLALSPRYTSDRTVYAATRQGEFYRSRQAGDRGTWELLSQFEHRVRSIAVSPAVSEDETLYVGTVSNLYRSTDGGENWRKMPVQNIAKVTGKETDFGVQVALSPAYGTDGVAYAGTDAGLYMTRSGGESWQQLSDAVLPESALVEAIAVSPEYAADGLVLVSTRSEGLLRSMDGGRSFERVADRLNDENLLIADYANPTSAAIQFSPTYSRDKAIFAYAQQELLRSTDAGLNWESVPLPPVEEFLASIGLSVPTLEDAYSQSEEPRWVWLLGFIGVFLGFCIVSVSWRSKMSR